MNGARDRKRVANARWLLVLIALIAMPIGLVAAQQSLRNHESPATGHAQVVTQGIADLPEGDVIWRVVERMAETRTNADPEVQVLGFVLATDEPVLLTNVTDDGNEDVALLAPGESFLVKAVTRQIRASLDDQAVEYLSFELVPATDADVVGDGDLLFASDPFPAPDGNRDIDLVRNVLELGETALLPDTGETIAILATEGAVDVLPSGGGGSRKLEAGESAIFEAGEVEIEAIEPTVSTRGPRAQFAQLTSSLQDGSDEVAAYVVAVIGPEIPPPIEQAPVIPTQTAESTDASGTGSITVSVYDCPAGMSLENLVGESCRLSEGGYGFSLSGPAGQLTLTDAEDFDGAWLWNNLPFGQYQLTQTQLPPGYDFYFIPGSAAVGGSAEAGYSVTIDDSAPHIGLNVFNFQPSVVTGSITVDINLCPTNASPANFDPGQCSLATGGYTLSLVSATDGTYYGMENATDRGGSVEWSGLPLGEYQLFVDGLPAGWASWLGPDGAIHSVSEYTFVTIGGDNATAIWIAIYAFADGVR